MTTASGYENVLREAMARAGLTFVGYQGGMRTDKNRVCLVSGLIDAPEDGPAFMEEGTLVYRFTTRAADGSVHYQFVSPKYRQAALEVMGRWDVGGK